MIAFAHTRCVQYPGRMIGISLPSKWASMFVYVCRLVCVEKDRQTEREGERECVCVCICVCYYLGLLVQLDLVPALWSLILHMINLVLMRAGDGHSEYVLYTLIDHSYYTNSL